MPSPPRTGHARQGRRTGPNTQLVALRLNAGLSRLDLQARSGVSRETIRLVEGGFVPSVGTQFALAQVFNLLPLDLWPLETQREVRR